MSTSSEAAMLYWTKVHAATPDECCWVSISILETEHDKDKVIYKNVEYYLFGTKRHLMSINAMSSIVK